MSNDPNCVRKQICADDEVFVETDGPIKIAKVYQTNGRSVVYCHHCDNTAVTVDQYHPYQTERTLCASHMPTTDKSEKNGD